MSSTDKCCNTQSMERGSMERIGDETRVPMLTSRQNEKSKRRTKCSDSVTGSGGQGWRDTGNPHDSTSFLVLSNSIRLERAADCTPGLTIPISQKGENRAEIRQEAAPGQSTDYNKRDGRSQWLFITRTSVVTCENIYRPMMTHYRTVGPPTYGRSDPKRNEITLKEAYK